MPDFYSEWIERVVLPSEDSTEVPYVLVNDEATVLYLVNQDTLSFHVGLSRIVDWTGPIVCCLIWIQDKQDGCIKVVMTRWG
jgi:DNA primase